MHITAAPDPMLAVIDAFMLNCGAAVDTFIILYNIEQME
jgi:hypothetical protein